MTAYTSPDGSTWTAIGSESIELGADVYVGIAVSSDGAEQSASAQLSQVSIGGLPAGMRHRHIGGPATARDRVALGRHVRPHRAAAPPPGTRRIDFTLPTGGCRATSTSSLESPRWPRARTPA